MTRDLFIRREAKQDIREARSWYRNVSLALGEQFLDAVDAALELMQERPEAFQVCHGSLRRILVRRFPYAVFYAVEQRRIVVFAVLHQARDPRVLLERI